MFTWKYLVGGQGMELIGTGVVRGTEVLQAHRELIEEKDRLGAVRIALVLLDDADMLELSTAVLQEIVEQDRLLAECPAHPGGDKGPAVGGKHRDLPDSQHWDRDLPD